MQFYACIIHFKRISDGSNSSPHIKKPKVTFVFLLKGQLYFEICIFMQVKKGIEFQIARFWANGHHSQAKFSTHWQARMQNLDAQVYLEKPNLIIYIPKTHRRKKTPPLKLSNIDYPYFLSTHFSFLRNLTVDLQTFSWLISCLNRLAKTT